MASENNISPIVKCPTCQKQVAWIQINHYRPFCSKRCRLIDLGAWANEEHRIAGEPAIVEGKDQLEPGHDDHW